MNIPNKNKYIYENRFVKSQMRIYTQTKTIDFIRLKFTIHNFIRFVLSLFLMNLDSSISDKIHFGLQQSSLCK